jgi:hypothetical protein
MPGVYVPHIDENDDQHLNSQELAGEGPRDPENELASTNIEITCLHCGRDNVMQSRYCKTMCVDCYQAFASRNTRLKVFGDPNWKEKAEQAGVDLWEQLPDESNQSYRVFKAYMSQYPMQKPTLKRTAEATQLSYGYVSQLARAGHFSERLSAWMVECDRATMHQRRNEMVKMNNQNIIMAQKLRSKLDKALDLINPEDLSVRDIGSLTKLMRDMERDARIDAIAQEEMQADLAKAGIEGSKDLKKNTTSESDLGEVLSVLIKSGAINTDSIGFKVTENKRGTTIKELIVKNSPVDTQSVEVEAEVV